MVRNKKLNLSKKKIALITSLAVLVCAVGGIGIYKKVSNSKKTSATVKTDIVTYGDVKSVTTGQAAVEPYERYEIISMISGDIISSPYDVGDTVAEGDILYQFDKETIQKSIERQELSLEQSKNNLNNARSDYSDAQEKLSITAPCDGIISGLTIKKGNDVSNNQQIAIVENTRDLEVSLPFTQEQINSIYVGQTANISSSVHMSVVEGKVSSISSESSVQENGSNTYNVTIELTNPGAFTKGLTVGGEIMGMQSPGFGILDYKESGTVKAQTTGTILNVNYSNGDYVKEGAVIATISSDAIDSQKRNLTNSELSYKSAQLSMSETRDSLEDYSITSPISGTVITKNAKAGDTIDRNNSQTALMVVADISKLKFSMEIDELDISTVHEGQEVDITCDALPGEEFVGKITSISVEGVATNGVTTYTAEVVIDEPGNLRPSMNVDASIIIVSAENVLIAPVEDVKTIMGISYVFLKDDTGTKGATEEDFMKAMSSNRRNNNVASNESKPQADSNINMPDGKERPDGMEIPEGFERPSMTNGEEDNNRDKEITTENEKNPTNKTPNSKNQKNMMPEAPDGFVVVIVETGISDDEYIEIKSGLKEFDEIQSLSSATRSSNGFMDMMGMMGGMAGGGGMPQGMQSGGTMPGGNRSTMQGGGMR